MQPQRDLTPQFKGILRPLAEVAACAHLTGHGGPKAKVLWIALLVEFGAGFFRATEAAMSALIGGGEIRATGGSDRKAASPGPLDRLEAIGAIERQPDGSWYLLRPAELGKPRRVAPPDQKIAAPMADMYDPPAEAPPLVVPFRESRGSPTGVPRDSRFVDGGKGGPALAAPLNEQEEEFSSCSSDERESRGTPVTRETWGQVRELLSAAGVYAKLIGGLLEAARDQRATPADVAGLCEYFTTNPDRLSIDAGALVEAIRSWRPGRASGDRSLWPQVKLPPSDDWREKQRAKQARSSRAFEIIKLGKRSGKDDATILGELAAEGLSWADQDG